MAEPAAALHAVFGADISPLQKRLDEAVKIAADKAKGMQREFEKSGKGAEEFGRRSAAAISPAGSAAEALGARMKGTQGAIAGAGAAIELLGAKGSPAVKSLAGSVSGLLAGGFTPLGLAIGAATALMAVFATGSDVASEATKRQSAALKEAEGRFSALAKSIDDAAEKRRATAAGVTEEELKLLERKAAIEARLRGVMDGTSGISEARRLELRKLATEATPVALESGAAERGVIDMTDALRAGHAEAAQLRTELDLITKRLVEMGTQAKVDRKAADAWLDQYAARFRSVSSSTSTSFSALDMAAANMGGGMGEIVPGSGRDATAAMRADLEATAGIALDATAALEGFRRAMVKVRTGGENPAGRLSARMPQESSGYSLPSGRKPSAEEVAAAAEAAREANAILKGSAIEGFTARMSQIRKEMLTIGQMGAGVADSLADSFADAFTDFAQGTKTASQAMKSFAASFASDVSSMISRQLALNAVTGMGGMIGSLFGGGGADPITVDLGGIGATTGVTAKSMPAGNVSVVVNNNAPGTTASAVASEGPNGREIAIIVEKIVSSDLERGGPIARTAERTHGLQRRGRRG